MTRKWIAAAVAVALAGFLGTNATFAAGQVMTKTVVVHKMPMRDAKGRFVSSKKVVVVHHMPMRDAKGRFVKKTVVMHHMPMRDAKGRFVKKTVIVKP